MRLTSFHAGVEVKVLRMPPPKSLEALMADLADLAAKWTVRVNKH